MATAEWTLKVKIQTLSNDALGKKNKWKEGDMLTIKIESHATVNMLKQRVALIVMAHPKHQQFVDADGVGYDDVQKVGEITSDGAEVNLVVAVPPEPKAAPVVLSDDEGLFKGEEAELPPAPSSELMAKELSDEELDKQGELKQQASEALEDGDVATAVSKFTEALMLGGCSAMMMAKRAEMLLKQKRYKAVVADATLALTLNPDSAKAFRARGKARRCLGDYEGSSADFSQAQTIDYDDGVADMHKYVKTRWEKIQLKAKQDAEAAAEAS
mmetsp:Transcript_120372/g.341052  ORF Transcript_120372/g.341052 Transcript_120372/m.341052 type:complete len:271 (-) Transcript_120372:235-1047(-)